MTEDVDNEASYEGGNEVVGEMFPNLLLVKRENLNYYDNVFESTPFSVQKNEESVLNQESETRHVQPPCSALVDNENSQNNLLNCNKIILGSKPNRVLSDGDNFEKSENHREESEVSIDENYFEELVTSYEPSVVLQDIQSYLHKSKRFCSSCDILFPEVNGYEIHVRIFHNEKHSSGILHQSSLTERRQHKCSICGKQYVAPHVLRKHLMTIHKFDYEKVTQNDTKEIGASLIEDITDNVKLTEKPPEEVTEILIENTTKKINNVKVMENTAKKAYPTVFENITQEQNTKIIGNTIKQINTPKVNHESSDLSNTCFHCKKSFSTQKSLIEHLYDILQMKRKNTEIVPVLKSVLFKCNKCDIHFTSSQLAADHVEHMEMLINWKCTICNRIFKKEDELSHERQHSVSNNYLTYNLGDLDVANILFRCAKCAAHFTESNFLYHFRDCGLVDTKTVTCKICNILLDYNLKSTHELDKHTESKPFTIIQCDVISDNPVKPIVNISQTRDKVNELLKSFREVKIVLQKIDSDKSYRLTKSGNISESCHLGATSDVSRKVLRENDLSRKLWRTRLRQSKDRSRKGQLGLHKNKVSENARRRRNLTYYYCGTCKCFMTKFKKNVHVQGRCIRWAKLARTCEHCGLILNNTAILAHNRLHLEERDLKLSNFRFFHLFNGRSINPPIPEYPKCKQCAVHFLTKSIRFSHICSEVTYHLCHLCKMKLSESAFKLHMTFHQYPTDRKKKLTIKSSQSKTDLNISKCVTGDNITSHNQLDAAETTLTENTNRTYTMNDKTDRNKSEISKHMQPTMTPDVVKHVADGNSTDITKNENELLNNPPVAAGTNVTESTNRVNEKTKLDALQVVHNKKYIRTAYNARTRRNLIYFYCETCKCFVTKFKKAAHVQGRCKNLGKIACTCEYCGIRLTSSSIVTHRRLHDERKDLKLNNFRFFNLYSGRSMNPPIPEYPKCSHCAVHFLTVTDRNDHICRQEAYQTCNFCEIKLSDAAFKLHMTFHQYASNHNQKNQSAMAPDVVNLDDDENVNDATTNNKESPNMPLDVLKRVSDETIMDTTTNNHELPNKTLHIVKDVAYEIFANATTTDNETLDKVKGTADENGEAMNLPHVAETKPTVIRERRRISQKDEIRARNAFQAVHKKMPVNIADRKKRNYTYFYCETCKCFVTKFKKAAHVQGRCKNLGKIACTCEYCGIRLTSSSIVTHRRLHDERKDLKLNNFRFFNLYSGRSMNPPIPEYPKCSHCAVHFLTVTDRNDHICRQEAYQTCNFCEIKLSDAAFKLHMTFHQYASNHNQKNQSAMAPDVVNLDDDENVNDATTNNKESPNMPLDVLKRVSDETIMDTTTNNHELPNKTLHIVKDVAYEIFANATTTDNETLDKVKGTADENGEAMNLPHVAETKPTVIRERRRISQKDEIRARNAFQAVHKKMPVNIADRKKRNYTYFYCETCKCFVTKFKKAAHVQGRCKNLGKIACTCEYCGIRLTSSSIVTHRRLHDERKDLKLNNFRFFNLYSGQSMNPPIPEYSKCIHCAIHFLTENAREGHVCSNEAYRTCHICVIKLSEAAFKLHMMFHEYATDRNNGVTSKNSHSATTLNINTPATYDNDDNDTLNSTDIDTETIDHPVVESEMEQTGQISQECKINDKIQEDGSLVAYEKIPVNIENELDLTSHNRTYSYCMTCKCFLTNFRKADHVKGRCEKLAIVTFICENCGLVLEDASIVTHRRLHEEKKDLKLKNFTFFDLYTGQSINPPIPEYPKCVHCAVHFLTKKAKDNHICTQQASKACGLCKMKLSQAAFKLHMMFHQYETDRNNIETSKDFQSAIDIKKHVNNGNLTNGEETNKNNDSIHNPIDVAVRTDTEKSVVNKNQFNSKEKYVDSTLAETTAAQTILAVKASQGDKITNIIEPDVLQIVNNKRSDNLVTHLTVRKRNVTYSYCETCKCFLPNLNKTAHLQGRCKKNDNVSSTCEHCGLIFNEASFVTHNRLHEERKNLTLKNFTFFNLYTGQSMAPPIPEYPKCTSCSVQFLTTTARNNHICTEQAYQLCHLCETKLSEAAFKLHINFHQYPNDCFKENTTNNSQTATSLDNEKALNDESLANTEHYVDLTSNSHDVAETRLSEKSFNRSKLEKTRTVNKKKLVNQCNVTYSFCETCKCFITSFRKDAHIQERCKFITKEKCTCEQCGLVLNSTSIVTHRRLHDGTKDLTLSNFTFFNLYTGRATNPPIPEYPKCTHCAVHFLTKNARKGHVCGKEAYQTCHICEIILSEPAFKLHMDFHHYVRNRVNKVILKNSQPARTFDLDKRVTKNEVNKSTINENELVYNPLEETETSTPNFIEIFGIVYTCVNCSVSVDTYDKAIEHCQGHYENEDQGIQTRVCYYCDLRIDAACYMDHQNLHETGKQIKFLKFDSYYLPADNNLWVKHIFKSLPNEKVSEILKASIYRFECRMKMDIIQQGDPNLTLYRCDQCNCFIEPSSMFKHADNSCFKLRHHPCSECGIPFNSSATRIDHEKVHSCPGITMNSYRIVVFNRELDKQRNRSYCLRKKYVLFQCRNCNVIIHKLQEDDHICEFSNVKKCPLCALLLHIKDFEKHVNTHKEFASFNYSNMKVIIVGVDNPLKDRNANTLKSNFKGAIYDYKMYVCNRCEVCVKSEDCISNHICCFGKQRMKCLKCDLYFSVGRLKTHTRSHEQDPDFVRSNMSIVSFDPCAFDQNKNTTTEMMRCSKDCEVSDSSTDSDSEILAANDTSIHNDTDTLDMTSEILEKETVKLYKCKCELHFLNESSITRHLGVCRSAAKISKQKCLKCGLLFTPNVLLTHLLAHHCKKSYIYDVIEMDHT